MAKVCRRTGKINYPSENAARRTLQRIRESADSVFRQRERKVEIAFYRCRYCPYFHLTSQRQVNGNGTEA